MKHGNVSIFIPHAGCPNQCSFCNQKTISGAQAQPSPDEVYRLLARAAENRERELEVAFFGGSFTAVDRAYRLSLLQAAFPYIQNGAFRGIRISTRPDAVTEENMEELTAYGVTAVELGAQSMDDRVLALNQRGHTAKEVEQAARLIKRYPVELGLQMMTGLMGDTPQGAMETAARLAALKPDTMRIYPTVVLRGTPLARAYAQGRYQPPGLEETTALCARLLLFLEAKGIRVIRVGLHASREVEENYVAGPYHPAMRELAQGRILLQKAVRLLEAGGFDRDIRVNPRDLSKMVGQNQQNRRRLAAMGFTGRMVPDGDVPEMDVQ